MKDRQDSSRLIPVNELSMVLQGEKDVADVLASLDLTREVDRPPVARARCNIPDASRYDVRELLGRIKALQPRNYDWHVLAMLESIPDSGVPGERTLFETTLRDFRDMAECSAVTFGRSSTSDWVIPDAMVSRHHGMVVLDQDLEVWVLDGRQGDVSTNGLYYMDETTHLTRIQKLVSPGELVSFGPPITYTGGGKGYLFRLRVEWLPRQRTMSLT